MSDSLGSILTAMVTPFDAAGAVDHEKLAALAGFLLAHGSDGLVVAGTTGESPTLSDDEKLAMFRTVVAAVRNGTPLKPSQPALALGDDDEDEAIAQDERDDDVMAEDGPAAAARQPAAPARPPLASAPQLAEIAAELADCARILRAARSV